MGKNPIMSYMRNTRYAVCLLCVCLICITYISETGTHRRMRLAMVTMQRLEELERQGNLTFSTDTEENYRVQVNSIQTMFKSVQEKLKVPTLKQINFTKSVNTPDDWRLTESRQLGDLVQRRLYFLQNPRKCATAEKFVCNIDKNCGFGCQLHHVVYCLVTAYATNRTMILQSKDWRYSRGGWETVFQPVSDTCASSNATSGVLKVLPIVDDLPLPLPDYLPLAIPDDLADRMLHFHGDPGVWWIGQFMTFLTRPQIHLKEYLEDSGKMLSFDHPVVGIHVRRTDKLISEAKSHGIEEYMTHVETWFDEYERLHPGRVQRKVFLASDDPMVLPEAIEKYPMYSFISDNNASKAAGPDIRYSSLMEIMRDIQFLSLSDYIVCTLSSHVCRMAYELMQSRHGDASQRFKSLDYAYYFGGGSDDRKRVKMPTYPEVKESTS